MSLDTILDMARCHIMTRSIGDGYGDEIMLREDAEEAVNRAFKEGSILPENQAIGVGIREWWVAHIYDAFWRKL